MNLLHPVQARDPSDREMQQWRKRAVAALEAQSVSVGAAGIRDEIEKY